MDKEKERIIEMFMDVHCIMHMLSNKLCINYTEVVSLECYKIFGGGMGVVNVYVASTLKKIL